MRATATAAARRTPTTCETWARGRAPALRAPATADRADRKRRRQDKQQRPEDVELLLHRQRPEMLRRTNDVVTRQVADRLASEVPVLHVERRRQHTTKRRTPARRWQPHHRRHRRQNQHNTRHRQQAPAPVRPELRQRNPAVILRVPQQVRRDQEARDHKENIDTDIATRKPIRPQVIQQHRTNGDGTQHLDIKAHAATPRGSLLQRALRVRFDNLRHSTTVEVGAFNVRFTLHENRRARSRDPNVALKYAFADQQRRHLRREVFGQRLRERCGHV